MMMGWGGLLLFVGVAWLAFSTNGTPSLAPVASDTHSILYHRFARGEIGQGVYLDRLAALNRR